MRKALLTGVFMCAVFVFAAPSRASASQLDLLQTNINDNQAKKQVIVVAKLLADDTKIVIDDQEITEIEPKTIEHTIAENETLISIAKQYNIEWQRIYDKNESIENPDLLEPGEKLVIPADDEELESRELPEPVVVTAAQPVQRSNYQPVAHTVVRGASDGNRYVAGYCTWYVKGRRPDLPNNLGNAATWVSRAAAQGIPTGSAPRVGAVGQRGNHVVYVESVNPDGTVTVSEMNRRRLYEKTTRTEPASYFRYIY